MDSDLCTYALKLLALAGGTYFWAWYLIWEYEYFSGRRKPKYWWEKEL
jgi:hypothetical protein